MTSERSSRLRSREIELVRALDALKAEYLEKAMPLADELKRLREHRDGRVIDINGVVYKYTGPLSDYKLPEER